MGSGTHIMWITSRAAGVTAVMLASLSVSLGLSMGSKVKRRGPDLRVVHEALALATIAAITLHVLALLADPWLKPSLSAVLLPGQIAYRPVAVAAGIVAAYGLVALGLGYYLRKRIGPARWRKAHRWTAAFWALAVVHGFTAGTDAGQPWFIASIAVVVAPALLLLASRTSERAAARRPAGHPQPPSPVY
jgi:methionine sulfoxide reductase heme-binding subunit